MPTESFHSPVTSSSLSDSLRTSLALLSVPLSLSVYLSVYLSPTPTPCLSLDPRLPVYIAAPRFWQVVARLHMVESAQR